MRAAAHPSLTAHSLTAVSGSSQLLHDGSVVLVQTEHCCNFVIIHLIVDVEVGSGSLHLVAAIKVALCDGAHVPTNQIILLAFLGVYSARYR